MQKTKSKLLLERDEKMRQIIESTNDVTREQLPVDEAEMARQDAELEALMEEAGLPMPKIIGLNDTEEEQAEKALHNLKVQSLNYLYMSIQDEDEALKVYLETVDKCNLENTVNILIPSIHITDEERDAIYAKVGLKMPRAILKTDAGMIRLEKKLLNNEMKDKVGRYLRDRGNFKDVVSRKEGSVN